MPWSPADAQRHTEKADTPKRQRLWAKVANRTRQLASESGDPDPDARAIRTANSTVARSHERS